MQAHQNPEKVSPVNIYRNCGDVFGSQAHNTSKRVEEATDNTVECMLAHGTTEYVF